MPAALLSWSLGQVLRLARIFAWIAGGFLVLAVALAALPGLVDWQDYKPRLATLLSSAAGRTVSLDGPLSVDLLPQPVLVVRDVRMSNAPGASAPTLLEARRLAVRLSWQALLQGRIEIVRIVLDEPRLTLEPGADGKPNWWLPAFEPAVDDHPGLVPVTLDRVEVRGGRLVHATGLIGQPIEAHAVDLAATLDIARGHVKIEGAAIVNGRPTTFGLGLNTASPAAPPVDLSIGLPGGRVAFKGWPGHRSDVDPLRGHLAVEAAFLPDFVESVSLMLGRSPIRVNEAVLRRIEASGDVQFDSRRLTIDGLSFATEGERIRGNLQIAADDAVAVSGRLSATNLDADRWLERLRGRTLLVPSPRSAGAAPLEQMPGLRLDLTVDAGVVRYRRDIVRDLVVSFRLEDDAFHLKEARAVLPGDFHLHRRVGFEGDETHPGYDGVIEVKALHLRQTLKWIGIDIAGVPADRLQTLRLNGRTRPEKGVVHVADATFSLDDQAGTVTADIALAIPTVISARLHLPQLNLDAYRLTSEALSGLLPSVPAPAAAGAADHEIEPPLIDIAATLDRAIYRGEPAHQVDAHVAIRGKRLTLEHVSVGALLGAQLEISGTVDDFGTAPRFDLAWRSVLPDADRMIDYVGLPRFINGLIGAAQLSGRAAGTPHEARVSDLSLTMLDATFTAAGEVSFGDELRFDFPRWSLATPNIGKLVAVAVGSPYRPMAEVQASGAFRGDSRTASFRGELALGGMALSGDLSSTLDARPRITASLHARQELRLDRWLPRAPASGAVEAVQAWANRPAPRRTATWPSALKGVDGTISLTAPAVAWGPYTMADFAVAARLQNGLLGVDHLSGTFEGAPMALSGAIDARRSPVALALDGSLRNISVPRAIAIAHTANDFGSDNLAVAIEGRLSLEDFALRAEGETLEAILLSVSGGGRSQGEVRPVVTRGSLSLATFATGIGSLFSTEMGFASAVIDNFIDRWIATRGSIEIGGGVITLREHTLNTPGATAYVTSHIDIRNGTLDTLIDLDRGRSGTINYSMSLRGPLQAPTLGVEPNRGR